MKSYKQINDSLNISDELIQKTIQSIECHNHKKKNSIAIPILVFCLSLFFIFPFSRENNYSSKIKEEAFPFEQAMVDNIETNKLDIGGTLIPNDNQDELKDKIPNLKSAAPPNDFNQIEINYYYWKGDNVILPLVQYKASDSNKRSIYLEITHMDMPHCYDINPNFPAKYHGYSFALSHNKQDYFVLAKKGEYYFEIQFHNLNQKECTSFLTSLFQS